MKTLLVLLAILAVGGSARAESETPRNVSPCELMKNPGAYDHALVEVTGLVSYGFENFHLYRVECSESRPGIWIEYGGTYKKGQGAEGQPVIVEDVHVPLVEDATFRSFVRRLEEEYSVIIPASLVGRFFAGEEESRIVGEGLVIPAHRRYGHMNCCSLLVVQQVRAFDPPDRTDVDYDPETSQPLDYRCRNSTQLLRQGSSDWLVGQRMAETEQRWRFDDARRVALEALARLTSAPTRMLKEKWIQRGRIVYELDLQSRRYLIAVSRPYELTFYAHDPRRIAWIATSAYEVSCN